MKINKQLSKNKNHFKGVNPCKFITIHQTGNTSRGAGAMNHARYINNGSSATWHYTVDDREVVQHFNDNVQCWHSGDGTGKGNTQSIGIELCVNSDGDYMKTIHNAIELVKYLMKKHNIPISNVVQHNKWSGKNCPQLIRSSHKGFSWLHFIYQCETPVKPLTPSNEAVGTSIDDLARRTIRGEFGNGEQRKKNLGSKYLQVQKRVNEMLK